MNLWLLGMMVIKPMSSCGLWGCNICSSYRSFTFFLNFFLIHTFIIFTKCFLRVLVLLACYGPLLVTIFLVASIVPIGLFPELWRFKYVQTVFWGDTHTFETLGNFQFLMFLSFQLFYVFLYMLICSVSIFLFGFFHMFSIFGISICLYFEITMFFFSKCGCGCNK